MARCVGGWGDERRGWVWSYGEPGLVVEISLLARGTEGGRKQQFVWASGWAVVRSKSQGNGGIIRFWPVGGSYRSWSDMWLDSSREMKAERVGAVHK